MATTQRCNRQAALRRFSAGSDYGVAAAGRRASALPNKCKCENHTENAGQPMRGCGGMPTAASGRDWDSARDNQYQSKCTGTTGRTCAGDAAASMAALALGTGGASSRDNDHHAATGRGHRAACDRHNPSNSIERAAKQSKQIDLQTVVSAQPRAAAGRSCKVPERTSQYGSSSGWWASAQPSSGIHTGKASRQESAASGSTAAFCACMDGLDNDACLLLVALDGC